MALYTIRPIDITEAMLIGTDVPETDYAEWNVGTAYTANDYCIVAAQHKIYQASVNVTGGSSPEIDVLAATPKWVEVSATNRWKPYDKVVGTQASQATSAMYALKPGLIDSIAILNAEASQVQIILADQARDVVVNGSDWSGAAGTTPPTGWTAINGAPTFLIDNGSLKISTDGDDQGISRSFAVTPGEEMQLLGKYRNTSGGDICQYALYDDTHSAWITTGVFTELPSSTVDSIFSYVFTVPAGCTSVTVYIAAKTSGDIVWFDSVSLSPTTYNLTKDMVSTINVIDAYTYCFEPIIWATNVTKMNLAAAGLPPYGSASVTVIITNTGGTAKCGGIVVGLKLEIGSMKYGPQPGLDSFSTFAENPTFGTWTVTKRANRKKLKCQVHVKNTYIDFVLQQLALYDSELLVWVGHEDFECLTIYGIWKSFDPVMDYKDFTVMDLEIRGVI